MTDFNNGMTERTDMMVNLLANSEKMKPKDERWYPTGNDDEVDERFDTYVSHNNNNENYDNNINNDNNNHNTYDNQTGFNSDHPQHTQNTQNTQNTEKNKSETNKFIDEEYEKLSPLEKRLRRLDIMRALGELRDLGCKVTNYNIDDDYYMMKYELDLHRSIRSKRNWLGLYSHMFVGVVKGVELLNNNYNPFDFSLRGLSDEVKADKNTYYEILGEIYEYHNVPGKKMNPWFRLFVTLIGVVVTVGGKNNAHKFIPNRAQDVEDDEDYIEKLRAKAAKDSQSQMSKQKQYNQTQQNQTQQNQQNQTQQIQQNNLDEYMNRQHENAMQKTRDLEELKRQELQYQQYNKMINEQQDKFNKIKNSLELTATASPRSQKSISNKSASTKSSVNKINQINQIKQNIKNDKDTMSEMSTTSKNTQASNKSSISQISINNTLAKKLSKMTNNKKQAEIKIDQISFGSNKKK
jgi:hypothetical protein